MQLIKRQLIILLIILFIPLASAITTETQPPTIYTDYTDFQILATRYDPYPVEPGKYFDLWLKIENTGSMDAESFTFVLKPTYPFSLDPNESPERSFGRILPRQSVLLHYKVRVDENAVEGDNNLNYEYTIKANRKATPGTITIKVQTIEAIIAVESVSLNPERIEPGQTAEIKLKLKNTADSLLRYVTVSLGLVTELKTQTSISYIELPFTSVGEGNEKTIFMLKGGEEKEISFKIIADPDAKSKPYKIPLSINYFDELGKNYTKTILVGVVVGAEPELGIDVDRSTIYDTKTSGDVTIKFINKGVSDIKFLYVTMKPSEFYEILSSERVYVGNIDSDDYETADFKLYVKKAKDGKIKIPLLIEYYDSNNKKYVKEEIVELKIISKRKLGLESGSSLTTIYITIIIIAVLYIIYKRWERRRKK